MPDLKISQLTDGGPLAAGDQIPVNRGGSNFRALISTDITWADLLTAIGGSTLTPLAWYHVTTAPDSSTTIDEAWVRAKDANEIFPEGFCLINAANVTNRLAGIRFQMAAGAGGRIQGVYDGFGNITEAHTSGSATTVATTHVDRWLDILTAANFNVKNFGCLLASAASGSIGDNSFFVPGSTLDLKGSSFFQGTIFSGGGSILQGASTANNVLLYGSLNLDNATTAANFLVGIGKSMTITDGLTYNGFSTEGNTSVHMDGLNASGDTVTVIPEDGIVYIVDGSTDITVSMPTGIYEGQQMMIFFKNGSAAVTWAGANVDVSFIAAPPAGWRLITFWDNANVTWR